MTVKRLVATILIAVCAAFVAPLSVQGQVGKGLMDFNTAAEKDLAALPNMTPAIAKSIIDKRPFASIVDLNTLLTSQGITAAQATAIYEKAFVHLNLNTCTEQEVQLIPRAGRRMAHEFDEYRPWKTWAQFDKEIGKYVDAAEVNRLKQYVFIPLNLNTATDADFMTIPGVGARMVHEFKEYRPWKTQAQFEKEISKYVDAKEVARLWRYMVIQ
jgi:DNA uptake protein ComE-like DNA-binding protein